MLESHPYWMLLPDNGVLYGHRISLVLLRWYFFPRIKNLRWVIWVIIYNILLQTINFFKLGPKLNLVDLPGYGFAYAKEEVKEAWEELVSMQISTCLICFCFFLICCLSSCMLWNIKCSATLLVPIWSREMLCGGDNSTFPGKATWGLMFKLLSFVWFAAQGKILTIDNLIWRVVCASGNTKSGHISIFTVYWSLNMVYGGLSISWGHG